MSSERNDSAAGDPDHEAILMKLAETLAQAATLNAHLHGLNRGERADANRAGQLGAFSAVLRRIAQMQSTEQLNELARDIREAMEKLQ